jgi:hypothetical protein
MTAEIENRFQLLITVSLFFPVLLANLGTIAGESPEKSSLILLQTSAMVGLYLIDYILFQSRKHKLSTRSSIWINRLLLIALGAFVIPILGITALSLNPPAWLAWGAAWLSGKSALFILAVPPVYRTVHLVTEHKKKIVFKKVLYFFGIGKFCRIRSQNVLRKSSLASWGEGALLTRLDQRP